MCNESLQSDKSFRINQHILIVSHITLYSVAVLSSVRFIYHANSRDDERLDDFPNLQKRHLISCKESLIAERYPPAMFTS